MRSLSLNPDIAHNGYLSNVRTSLGKTEEHLSSVLSTYPGGSQAAYREARAIQDQAEEAERKAAAEETSASTGGTTSPQIGTPVYEPTKDVISEAILRQRLNVKSSVQTPVVESSVSSSPGTNTPARTTSPERPTKPEVHPLSFHPDDRISGLAKNVDAQRLELTSTGVKRTVWPENVTYWNFTDYLLVPTLVYELEYPRTTQ